MKALIMYQLEGVRDDNAVSKLFSKHFPNGVDKFAGNIFSPLGSAPDFCKLVGFSSLQDTSKLEQIAGVITQEGYDRKIDKFNQKCDKMQHKLMSAQKAAKTSATVGQHGGLTNAVSLAELINKAEELKQQQESDTRVAKAKNKLDNYLERNKTLHESSKYTTATKSAGGLISWGAGTESSDKNIFEEIETSKKSTATFVDTSMDKLKEFLTDLLKLASKVGIMAIMDGNKTSTVNSTHNVKFDQLTSSRLMNAQNREIFYITK